MVKGVWTIAITFRLKILFMLIDTIMQRSVGGSRIFIAKNKACKFDPSRFRWFSIAEFRRNAPILLEGRQHWSYHPNYGYDPYWADGDWVFNNKTTANVTDTDHACGEDCHEMYYEYGQICGRGRNYTHKTFDNYCQLLNEDCSGREKWMIAYRGACQDELKTRPTAQKHLVPRADRYIADFYEKYPSTIVLIKIHFTNTPVP